MRGACCLRRVLDDDQVMLLRERHHRVHVRRLPVEMDGHEGARARGDGGGSRFGVHVPRRRIDVDDHRRGAGVEHGVDRRGEGEVGYDHLVARADVEGFESEVQRDRAIRDGERMRDAEPCRELALEAPHERALRRDPVRRDAFADVFELVAGQDRLRDGDAPRMGRRGDLDRAPVGVQHRRHAAAMSVDRRRPDLGAERPAAGEAGADCRRVERAAEAPVGIDGEGEAERVAIDDPQGRAQRVVVADQVVVNRHAGRVRKVDGEGAALRTGNAGVLVRRLASVHTRAPASRQGGFEPFGKRPRLDPELGY